MQDAFVAATDEILGDGIRAGGSSLGESLRHTLAITLARFMREVPVAAASPRVPGGRRARIDAARAGSTLARRALADENVGGRKRGGPCGVALDHLTVRRSGSDLLDRHLVGI